MLVADIDALRAVGMVLATASPRRVEIVNGILGLQARVVSSTFEENLDKSLYTPVEYVEENAYQKAKEVFERLSAAEGQPPRVVIGADTVVVMGERILEKPPTTDAAIQMLTSLSGSEHKVITGVALLYGGDGGVVERAHRFHESTSVSFAQLPLRLIEAYVASGEPMDKAGGYGIQGLGGSFVCRIEGCYHNVVGFPMHRFCVELDTDRLR